LSDSDILALIKATPQLKITSNTTLIPGAKPRTWINVTGGYNGGFLDDPEAHTGILADGTNVLIVPLPTGGSAGVDDQLVFAGPRNGHFRYAGVIASEDFNTGSMSGHLQVGIIAGVIVAALPYYRPNDADCCPSAHFLARYTVTHGKLHLLSTSSPVSDSTRR
jgi:hypothetical protein